MNLGFGIAVAVVALLGLALLVSGWRRLVRRRLIAGSARGLMGLALLAAAALGALAALNLYTYHRLTHEAPVCELRLRAVAPQSYRVELVPANGTAAQVYDVRGDEWQIDARILKWRAFATWIGFDTLYRLERLSGRYRDLEKERTEPRTVYLLSDDRGLDVWSLARRYAGWLPVVDAVYGSSTYLPLADGARYTVTVSASGLVARAANEAAETAVREWR